MTLGKDVIRAAILLTLVAVVAACSSKKSAPTAPVQTFDQKVDAQEREYEAAEKVADVDYKRAKEAHGNLTAENAAASFDAVSAAIAAKGESMTVEDNAETVLKAPELVKAQLTKAEAAVKALEELSGTTAAETTKRSTKLAEAKAVVIKIKAWLGEAEDWEKAVKGPPTDTIVMIAASHAKDAAMEVRDALERPDPSIVELDELEVDPVTGPDRNVFGRDRTHKEVTKKFEKLFSGTSEQAYENQLVPAISLEGKTNDESAITAGGDGAELGAAYTYMGIAGSAICRGGGCKINEDDTFSANWYFVPIRDTNNLSDAYFVENTVDGETSYAQALYAEYGLWLSELNGDLVLNRVAGIGKGSAPSGTPDLSEGTTAKYTGDASGLSYIETTDDDDNTMSKSGQFTADVELTLTFGGTPELSATIDKFKGSAVDTDWVVMFANGALTYERDSQSFSDSDTGFGFNARAFGRVDAAPTGFYGDFFKHFDNDEHAIGRAAGVFATTKE